MIYKYIFGGLSLIAGLAATLWLFQFVGGYVFGPLVRLMFTNPLLFIGLFALVGLSVIWLDKKVEAREEGE